MGDFGLARQAALAHPSKTHASTRHMAGTYGYICPDYASTGHYDARCDVYSFGVVCLQMLTGLPAITEEGATLAAAMKKVFQVRPLLTPFVNVTSLGVDGSSFLLAIGYQTHGREETLYPCENE